MSTEDIYAEPDMTKKVRKRERDRDRGQRGDPAEDSVEMVVDIYQSVDDCVPGPQAVMVARDDTAGRQAQAVLSVPGQSSKTERRPLPVVAGCLGILCLILMAVTIAQAVHNRSPSNSMTNDTLLNNNLNREKDLLQREVNQLKAKIANCFEHCKTGWKKFGCSCYYRTTGEKTWQENRKECLVQGADLVVINSEEEQVFIRGFRTGGSSTSWIGLTRTRGSWTWVDGTPLTTRYWGSGYPDDGDKNCAAYDHSTDPGTWSNVVVGCVGKGHSICETK